MMPFSVLRIWGLGLVSWAVLGLGAYLGYRAYEEFTAPPVATPVRVAADVRDDRVADREELDTSRTQPERVKASQARWQPWALLAGAIACFGVSCGGYWPVSLMLSGNSGAAATSFEPISTKHIERPDGSRLHVEIFGQQNGPTLLLTHGWSLDRSNWDYVKAELAKEYRVVTWDLPGLGKSQGPINGDFSLEKMARDLEAVRQTAASQGPVMLVGHSIGGMLQQTYCRLFPENLGQAVQAIAFVHTTYTNPLRTNVASTLVTALEWPLIIPLQYFTIALAPVAWLSNWQSYWNGSLHIFTRFASFTGKQTRQQLDHGARLAAESWPATVARGNLAMLKFDEQTTLPQIHVPTLVIGGNNDRMTLRSASEHLETLLPNNRPITTDGGHLGHWEFGNQVAEILLQFADQTFASDCKIVQKTSLTQPTSAI
jgi:pimeloyl-ACP methyl ester carboxylesterase